MMCLWHTRGVERLYLGEEHRVVHPYAVYSLLVGVEEANILAQDVECDRGIPSIGVLVIPARSIQSSRKPVHCTAMSTPVFVANRQ